MGFSRQEYWNGLPFPSPGDLPNPGIEPGSPALQADSLPTELREAQEIYLNYLIFEILYDINNVFFNGQIMGTYIKKQVLQG